MAIRRPTLLSLAAVLPCVLVAACGSTSDAGGADGGGGTGERSRATLRVAVPWAFKRELSPYSYDADELTLLGIGETLVRYSDDSTRLAEPGLAESFTVVNPRTVRFTLRSGALFHDGSPVDARAVAAAIRHAADARPAAQTLTGLSLTVSTPDSRTVEVVSATPDPILAQRFAQPQTLILAPKAYEKDPNKPDARGAGSGPFVLTQVRGQAGLRAEAFDRHWGGVPRLAAVEASVVTKPESRAASLRSGEIDIAQQLPIAQLGQIGERQVLTYPAPRFTGVFFNTKKGPMADPAQRSAAAAAITPDEVFHGPYEKRGEVGLWLLRGPEWRPFTRPAARVTPSAPKGLRLKVVSYDNRPELPGAVSIVAEQLRRAGFTVDPPEVRAYEVMEPGILSGAYDVVVSTQGKGGDKLIGLTDWFSCKGSYNVALLCDKGVEAALARAGREADPTRRPAATAAAAQAILDVGAVVPLVHEDNFTGRRESVSGLEKDVAGTRLVTGQTSLQE